MSRPRSLRRDMTLGLVAGLTALWFLAMLGGTLIIRMELDEMYDSLMEQTADRLLPLTIGHDVSNLPRHAEALLLWVLRDSHGQIIMKEETTDPTPFANVAPDGFSTDGDYRHFVRRADGRALEIASPLEERREATWGVVSALLLPALIVLPLSLILAIWFTKSRLQPVADLSAEVAGRGPKDLRLLETSGLQAELVPVRDEMNRLMANLSAALEAERAFSANAAHELRTPIAATLAHVQRLVVEADGPVQERARSIESELKRITRLVEKLLQLARAENLRVDGERLIDAVPIVALVADDFGLEAELPSDRVLTMFDQDVLAILVRNLLENAVTHGYDAKVSLSADGLLRVWNRGRIIPPEKLPQLSRRFERAEARTSGSGLGLAIVAAIAQSGGHRVHMASPAEGYPDGFEISIMIGRPASQHNSRNEA